MSTISPVREKRRTSYVRKPQILDLGCGNNKTKGSTGIDNDPNSDADIRHDLTLLATSSSPTSYDEKQWWLRGVVGPKLAGLPCKSTARSGIEK